MVLTGKTQIQVDADKLALKNASEIVVLRKYLADTDWYVVRQTETGTAAPAEVLEKRRAARDRISSLEV